MVKAFMVKYKIKMNTPYNHSDYGYQKLFRAIYGYTQVVTKSNGKKYIYHRPGVLSSVPYIKKGKNEVILTKAGFSRFIEYLKTGKNPTHKWEEKGNWSATYSMYDVDVSPESAQKAIENLIKETVLLGPDGNNRRVTDILEDIERGVIYDENIMKIYDKSIKQIQAQEWYQTSLSSPQVKRFDNLSKLIKVSQTPTPTTITQ